MPGKLKKPHQRTIDKINLLVRLELANPMLSSTQIALLCGVSINRFSILKASPYYQKIHNTYTTGLLADIDVKVKDNYILSQNTLEMGVPIALQGLLNQALNAKDERVKNKAFNDILDRDGRFAKVSRIGVTTAAQDGVASKQDNDAVEELVHALGGRKALVNNAGPTNAQNTKSTTPSISTPPITKTTQ